jgi:hypothetical protein
MRLKREREAEREEVAREEAEAKRRADEAEAKRRADEAEAKRRADEAGEARRMAEEAAEAKRKASVEARRKAQEDASRAAFVFLRDEKFSGNGQTQTVKIYRCAAFAKALGLAAGKTDLACEFVLTPGAKVTGGSHDPAQVARALMDLACEAREPGPLLDAARVLLEWSKATPLKARRRG